MIIAQGKDTPLNANSGTVPDMSDALLDWFQPITFGVVTTVVDNFQSVQTQVQTSFQGVWQPFTDRQLLLKPEGQRAWSWFQIHADPSLTLNVDSVIIYLGKQYRVMTHKDYSLYKYVEYHVIEDYTGAGPAVVSP